MLKNKKPTINPKANDNKCFQYALNHEQIKSHLERISNINPFIDQYNRIKINFPSHKKDWNGFEKIIKQNLLILLISYISLTILKK